jgi:hypothetical protein
MHSWGSIRLGGRNTHHQNRRRFHYSHRWDILGQRPRTCFLLSLPQFLGSKIAFATPSNTSQGTTLQSGYYWIRAVASPNFHKYLQTKPIYSTGTAILDTYTTAGQFQVISGQLVELINSTYSLYANVIGNATNKEKLSVVFSESKNTYGTFQWSGDALQWTGTNVTRQNLSAWLVCGEKSLWVNLGAYGYMTPAGCADQTVSGDDRYCE